MKKLFKKLVDKIFGKRCKCDDKNVVSFQVNELQEITDKLLILLL